MNLLSRTTRPCKSAAIASLLALTIVTSAALAQPGQGRGGFGIDPRADDRTYRFEPTGEDLPYCVFASSKISADEPAPLVISLHGLGAGPQIMCNATAIDLAEEGGYILAAPMGYNVSGWYGSPVIQMGGRGGNNADALPPETLQQYSEQDVMNVLAMVRDEFNVDPDRIYLTGHSMGGAGTYYLGAEHADIWAAIAPVAPAAFRMVENRAELLKKLADADVPVMVVHGDADEVVAVDTSHTWVATMEEIGMEHEYVELPGISHGPVITASQEAIFGFFDKHSK
jgi:predicted peptidase